MAKKESKKVEKSAPKETPAKAKAAPTTPTSTKKAAPTATSPAKRRPSVKKSATKKEEGEKPSGPPPEPTHGRRAKPNHSDGDGPKVSRNTWMTASSSSKKVEDTILGKVQTIQDDVDDNTGKEYENKRRKAKEDLETKLAIAPTGYQAALPTLSELDITSTWDTLLQQLHKENDMSCLTGCLAQELDDDVQWNPDMLLVQLTSELLDVQEKKANEAPLSYMVVDENELGKLKGGEVRKRKEKEIPGARPAAAPEKTEGGKAAAAPAPAAKAAPPKVSATEDNKK